MTGFSHEFKFVKNSQVKIYYPRQDGFAELFSKLDLFNKESKNFIVTDENLAALHLDFVLDALAELNIKLYPIVVPASEASKSLETYSQCISEILSTGIDKFSTIVSFGGGVVNNLAGFIASTLYRGVQLVHIPTTLLSQADAAVDVKQAINSSFAKNSIGSYYPPTAVVICVDFLRTLSERFVIDGFAEVVKHALCQDKAFYHELLKQNPFTTWDAVRIDKIVRKSVALKLETMSEYESPDNDLLLFNEVVKQYGHALGHAVEHASNNDLLHGESIAIGMAFSAFAACRLGLSHGALLEQHIDIFRRYNLPYAIPAGMDVEKIAYHIRYDKHFYQGKVSLGLLQDIGTLSQQQDSYFSRIAVDEFMMLVQDYKEQFGHGQ